MIDREKISDIYLWFDTEFTTLELEEARLLQVAMIATNARLERIMPAEHDLNLYVSINADHDVSPWVAENLPALVARCKSDESVSISAVDARVSRWLEEHFGPTRKDISDRPVLAGNSLCCDWFLARKYLPRLSAFTNYRMLDVSAWKVHWINAGLGPEFSKDTPKSISEFLPFALVGAGDKHDAYFDVQASIAELNFYMRNFEPAGGGQ